MFGPSTAYRDYRTSAFQQYAIASEHCLGLVPEHSSFEQCAAIGELIHPRECDSECGADSLPLTGVAAVAAALAIGSALGIAVRGFAPRSLAVGAEGELPEWTKTSGSPSPIHEPSAQFGEWILIWGGERNRRVSPKPAVTDAQPLHRLNRDWLHRCTTRKTRWPSCHCRGGPVSSRRATKGSWRWFVLRRLPPPSSADRLPFLQSTSLIGAIHKPLSQRSKSSPTTTYATPSTVSAKRRPPLHSSCSQRRARSSLSDSVACPRQPHATCASATCRSKLSTPTRRWAQGS